jgi:hypothetical protein
MKKLSLESLRVDGFATSSAIDAMRGTVAGGSARCTILGCPYSHGGTCVISCRPCDLANEIGA